MTPADRTRASELLEVASQPGVSVELVIRNAKTALDLLPGHPVVQRHAARLLMGVGETAAAMAVLKDHAAAGLYWDLRQDRDFAALNELDVWSGLLASFEDNIRPVEAIGRVEVRAGPATSFLEGIALDGLGGVWASSYRTGNLTLVDPTGGVQAVVKPPSGHGGLFGMAWDAQRSLLWAGTGWAPVVDRYSSRGDNVAGIVAFDHSTGAWVRELHAPANGEDRIFGDLCLLPGGGLVASESLGAALYRWSGDDAGQLKPWITKGLVSPQGVTYDPGGKLLFIADYALGILAVPVGDANPAEAMYSIASNMPVCMQGVDGLYWYHGWLIGIQNGVTPCRVVAWGLDYQRRRIVEERVLCANATGMDEPTLGFILEEDFWFVANSHWPKWSDEGEWISDRPPANPVLLRVALPL